LKLPISARLALIKAQANVFKKGEANPVIGRALQVLAPTLNAAGVTKTNDPDTYYQFTGALSDVIQQYIQDNKAQPKPDDIQAMGSRLLQQIPTKRFFGLWNTTTPMFQLAVPEEDSTKITEGWREYAHRALRK